MPVPPLLPGHLPALADPVELPAPVGDAATARALANAYRRTADALDDLADEALHVLLALDAAWAGAARAALGDPAVRLRQSATAAAEGLRASAASLDRLAADLDHARHRHRWSTTKLLAVGLGVVCIGAVVVVTGGALLAVGTVEGAEAVAAVEAAIAAGEAAGAASAGAASALAGDALTAALVRSLATFTVPRLLQGARTAGTSALQQYTSGRRVDLWQTLLDGEEGFLLGHSVRLPDGVPRPRTPSSPAIPAAGAP